MRNSIILIPAYKPSNSLIKLIKKLKENSFSNIIVVDDGSGAEYKYLFQEVKLMECTLVVHSMNKGKGAALKTGFKLAKENFNIEDGIITVDADNQHDVLDVVKIYDALKNNNNSLIIGTRKFDRCNVPIKSYIGNKITSFVFKISTGTECKDTQTGLRGVPANMVDMALSVHGSRYEYEYNFLTEAVEQYTVVSVSIQTIYFDENKGSHFMPIKDSFLIYNRPLKFLASSLVSFLVDVLIFYLMLLILPFNTTENIIIASVVARLSSGVINYCINKNSVFRLKKNLIKSATKYTLLFIIIMILSAIGTAGMSMIITSAVLAKFIVDTLLFMFGYSIQKNWVFTKIINARKASKIWKSCTALILVFFISFSLLQRFVIPQGVVLLDDVNINENTISSEEETSKESIDESIDNEISKEDFSESEDSEIPIEPIITENSYTDENIQISIETIRKYDTDIYIAEIIISDSSYLNTGLAENSFGTNLKSKTSEIAEENNAILSINGDFYGFRDYGYVMRNGYLYREIATEGGNEDLVIYENGSMDIINEANVSANELEENGAVQIFSFGPGLISNGEILVDENSEVDGEDPSNPRTAIAMIEENHYIFMVADGRTNISEGLSIEEMAIVLSGYDCEVAYNLDGGGSSTMVFMGELVNNPTTNGRDIKERSVSDIVYIG